jgi:hypothetical protein
MYRIDSPGSVDGHWQPPNPKTGAKGTVIAYDWLDELQEEAIAIVVAGGGTPTKGNRTQLVDAIAAMIAAGGGGGGGGFDNTLSNVGGGVGVWHAKVGPNHELRTFVDDLDAPVTLVLDAATKRIYLRPTAWTRHEATLWKKPGYGEFIVSGAAQLPSMRGTSISVEASTGSWLSSSSSALDVPAGPIHATYDLFRADWNVVWTAKISLPDVLTTARWWCGLTSGDPVASDNPTTLHSAMVRRSSSAGDGNLVFYSSNGSTSQTSATSIAAVANAEHLVRIATSASSVRLWIDNVQVAEHLVSIPAPTQMLGWLNNVVPLAGSIIRRTRTQRLRWTHL